MNDNTNDIEGKLAAFKKSAKSVDDIVRMYESKIEKMRSDNDKAVEATRLAKQQTANAELQSKEALDKYNKALSLRDGQYEQLIRDLFETPKVNLENSIKKQSRNSNRLTLMISTMSILTTLGVAMYSLYRSSDSIDTLLEMVRSINQRTDAVVDNMLHSDPNALMISNTLRSVDRQFSRYGTQNDVRLAYIIKVGAIAPAISYKDYIKAFRYAGIAEQFIPSEQMLERWDREYIELCDHAIRMLEPKPGDAIHKDGEEEFNRYKTDADSTNFGGWGFSNAKTYAGLSQAFRYERDRFQNQLDFNMKK